MSDRDVSPAPPPGTVIDATGRSLRRWRSIGILLIVIATVVHAGRWAFFCDDAYISLRYARNLADHGQVAFNLAPLERVEGYTNFLWVLVLAAARYVGLDLVATAGVLDTICLAGLSVATIKLCDGIASDRAHRAVWPGLVAAALLASCPEYVVWGNGGLETSMAGLFTVAAIAAWLAERARLAAVLTALAALTRLDSLVPIAAFGLTWLPLCGWAARHLPGYRWQTLVHALALFAVPLLLHLWWRHSYYGAWLPNTWAVKLHGARLRDTWGVAYVDAWVQALHLPYLSPALLLLRRRHLPVLAAAMATVAYAWSVGGDFMAYSRLLLVATAMVAVLLAAASQTLLQVLLRHRVRPRWAYAIVLGPAVALLSAELGDAQHRYARDLATPEGWIDRKWEGITAMQRFAAVGVATGTWMARNLPGDTLISVGAAGAVPYASNLPTVDAYGLIDPTLAHLSPPPLRPNRHARPGHQLFAPASYIRQRDPDLLCHVGFRGSKPPHESQAVAPFGRGYRWACIQPGPAQDGHGGLFDAGWYCCRRLATRPVGPFE